MPADLGPRSTAGVGPWGDRGLRLPAGERRHSVDLHTQGKEPIGIKYHAPAQSWPRRDSRARVPTGRMFVDLCYSPLLSSRLYLLPVGSYETLSRWTWNGMVPRNGMPFFDGAHGLPFS